jgi:hypothetical protein
VPQPLDVEAFLAALVHARKDEVNAVRALIRAADARIVETVKWNAPSFRIDDDFATMRIAPKDVVQVVLHTGVKKRPDAEKIPVEDPTSMLVWAAPDRAVVTFTSRADVDARSDAFAAVLRQWIQAVSGP